MDRQHQSHHTSSSPFSSRFLFSVTRLKPGRKYTHMGKLATELGWGYGDVVKQFEDKRRERSAAWYEKRKAEKAAFAKAKA